MSTVKEYIDNLEKIKTKMILRSSHKATNSGFRQVLNRLDKINLEIRKLEKGNK